MSFFSAALTLFLVMDPIGNVPVFAALLKDLNTRRRCWVIVRENLIALAALLLFLVVGPTVMRLLGIGEPALKVSGGLVLLLVALDMIFPRSSRSKAPDLDGEPLVVPLAIPMIAGPSAVAVVMLMMTQHPERWATLLLALLTAWTSGAMILLLAGRLQDLLSQRVLTALERLMGMILVVLAVQMSMSGVRDFIAHASP